MQLKLFTMPVFGGEAVEDELNKFLRSHRVLQLERHYCSDNGGYWAMLVEYADGDPIAEAPPQTRQPRDVTAGMSDEEKQRYNMFRDIRKDLAQQKACPAYLVFTNEELAILARQPELTDDSVKGLKGIAPQRLKDHVFYFLDHQTMQRTANANDEKSDQPDAQHSESGEPA